MERVKVRVLSLPLYLFRLSLGALIKERPFKHGPVVFNGNNNKMNVWFVANIKYVSIKQNTIV